MLLSRVRERDVVGNTVLENMTVAEKRLGQLGHATIRGGNLVLVRLVRERESAVYKLSLTRRHERQRRGVRERFLKASGRW